MRRWDVTWLPEREIWHFHIRKPFGKPQYGGVFLVETWVGPLRLRVWKNPKAAYGKPFRVGRTERR